MKIKDSDVSLESLISSVVKDCRTGQLYTLEKIGDTIVFLEPSQWESKSHFIDHYEVVANVQKTDIKKEKSATPCSCDLQALLRFGCPKQRGEAQCLGKDGKSTVNVVDSIDTDWSRL